MSDVLIQRQLDWTQTSPSVAIIEALAAIENVDPMQIDIVLHDYLDSGALEALVTDDRPVSLSFPLDDYWIQIDSDGIVVRAD